MEIKKFYINSMIFTRMAMLHIHTISFIFLWEKTLRNAMFTWLLELVKLG